MTKSIHNQADDLAERQSARAVDPEYKWDGQDKPVAAMHNGRRPVFAVDLYDEDGFILASLDLPIISATIVPTDKYGDSWDNVIIVETPEDWDENDMECAANPAAHYSCSCEHDCCGHLQSYLRRVMQLDVGKFAVSIHNYRNV